MEKAATVVVPTSNFITVEFSLDPCKWSPQWVPDQTALKCQICNAEFNLFYRRHHCRRCGSCICSSCSTGKIDDRRVCNNCFTGHHNALIDNEKRAENMKKGISRIPYRNIQANWLLSQGIITNNETDGESKLAEQLKLYSATLIDELLTSNIPIVDLLIDTLSLGDDKLDEKSREAFIQLLSEIIENNKGLLQFNFTTVPQNSSAKVRTRLHRIKTLLWHENEEIEGAEEIFSKIGYKSVLFEKILAGYKMRYTLVLDKSGSMTTTDGGHHQTRWVIAKDAVEHMAEALERLVSTDDGMTLWMFSSPPHKKYNRLKTSINVEAAFEQENPHGRTDLAGVLQQSLTDHLQHGEQEHILVVTDGEPDNQEAVLNVLVEYINKIRNDEELGITFMQVGKDHAASDYLHDIQDHLVDKGAKFAVVDSLTHKDYHGSTLCDVIKSHLPHT